MQEPLDLSSSQPARRDARRADQDRTLTAMLELEVALESAAPGREPAWRTAVLAALAVLDEATNDEYANANNPDSLLSDIKRTQPRLRTRVRGLRTQYKQLRQAIVSIRSELADPDEEGNDYADVRQRLSWILTALRHQRARESDLIYEAYYDAVPRRTRRRTQPVTLFVGACDVSRDRRESIRCSRLHACAARSCRFAGFRLPALKPRTWNPTVLGQQSHRQLPSFHYGQVDLERNDQLRVDRHAGPTAHRVQHRGCRSQLDDGTMGAIRLFRPQRPCPDRQRSGDRRSYLSPTWDSVSADRWSWSHEPPLQ